MRSLNGCTSPMPGASGGTSCNAPSGRRGRTVISSRCWVTEEIAHRQHTRLGRLTRRAHLPFLKTIDDFNFTYQSSLRLHMLGSALAPDFVTGGRSLIFSGKPGRGKMHLAIAVAYRAIQNGFDAFFTTAATLVGHSGSGDGGAGDAIAR